MLLQHIHTAFRSFTTQKLYSGISVFGLAISIAVCILIALFIRHETSFESMHPDSDNSYRLNWANLGTGARFGTFFNPVAPILAEGLPEIESFTRLAFNQHLVTIEAEQQFRNISFVDPSFFDIFSYPTILGSTETIEDRTSVVLTEAAALELFNETDAIGRVLTIDDQYDFQVTAVVENNPSNTHLVSNIFVNVENVPAMWNYPGVWENMGSDVMYSYIHLANGADPVDVRENALEFLAVNLNLGPEFLSAVDIMLQPIGDIHFTTDLQNEMSQQDDVTGVTKPLRQSTDVFIFTGVAVLTLVIAIFNFVNLQIVQSSKRNREVAVRRIVGAEQSTITAQFLVETTLIALIALLVALTMVNLLLPYFSNTVSVPLAFETLLQPLNGIFLLLFVLAIALLSGAYPALINAKSSPVNALRGEVVKGLRVSSFRSGLVVVQFAISIGLMISCGVVNNQINFALTKSLGFDPSEVVVVNMQSPQARESFDSIKDQLIGYTNINSVSAGSIIPTQSLSDGSGFTRVDDNDAPILATRRISVSDGYFDTLSMNFVAGRELSDDFATDTMPAFGLDNPEVSGGVVFNEAAIRSAGWAPEEAIGQQLFSQFSIGDQAIRLNYTVVGVVNDAHYGSVRTEIGPVSYTLDTFRNSMIIKIDENNIADTLTFIDDVWQQNVPEVPIRRSVLSDSYSAFYAGENRTFILFTGFAAIAVLIACLGLYGLASFMAERRTKEISIRKVLGATVRSIAGLLAWDFSKLVILANIVAWPAAWWLMQDWLTSFAYRTDISLLLFFFAGFATFALALVTTFQRAYSVAVSNPVDALRTE
ncbi:MAG: FtsX-like permease family protein [Pseudomonadales bacterium]|nr:FtsX-like permease family protein [Pseudomonadales bacterium]